MTRKLARRLFKLQCQHGMLDEEKRSLYEYAYGVLIRKVIAYLLLGVIGFYMGTLKEVFIFLMAFTILRQFAGGIHLKKAENCIVVSVVLISTIGRYLNDFPNFTIFMCLPWLISMRIIILLAPVGCDNKRFGLEEIKIYKIRTKVTLISESAIATLFLIIKSFIFAKGIVLAQIIVAMSLVLGWVNNYFCLRVREN